MNSVVFALDAIVLPEIVKFPTSIEVRFSNSLTVSPSVSDVLPIEIFLEEITLFATEKLFVSNAEEVNSIACPNSSNEAFLKNSNVEFCVFAISLVLA